MFRPLSPLLSESHQQSIVSVFDWMPKHEHKTAQRGSPRAEASAVSCNNSSLEGKGGSMTQQIINKERHRFEAVGSCCRQLATWGVVQVVPREQIKSGTLKVVLCPFRCPLKTNQKGGQKGQKHTHTHTHVASIPRETHLAKVMYKATEKGNTRTK